MDTDFQNRGRCNINKKRINLKIVFSCLIASFLLSFLLLFFVDLSVKNLLDSYLDTEVERITSIIVHKSLKEVNNKEKYYVVQRENENIENIKYDMNKVNNFRDELVQKIQSEFYKVENGIFDDYNLASQEKLRGKYPFFKNGYLCEVGFNSLRGSIFFGNLGPIIPIKLSFLGFVSSDVDVNVKEYGVNNVIVETDVVVVVSNLITLPVSTRVHNTTIKEILSIEIIQGKVPSYYVNAQ